MNSEYPHDIKHSGIFKDMFRDVEVDGEEVDAPDPFRYVMLTPDEANALLDMTVEDRGKWMAEMPSWERLARFLESQEAPEWIVKRARAKDYSDFDSTVFDMPQVRLIKDCKVLMLHRVVEAVKSGAFDATQQESDSWADRQDGEVKAFIDQMKRNESHD